MTDIQKEIADAVKAKTIVIGSANTVKALQTKELKFVAVSSKAEKSLVNKLLYYAGLSNIPCHIIGKTSMEVGSMCGKPYSISAFGVLSKK